MSKRTVTFRDASMGEGPGAELAQAMRDEIAVIYNDNPVAVFWGEKPR